MKVVIELIGNESKESLLATSNYLRELAEGSLPVSTGSLPVSTGSQKFMDRTTKQPRTQKTTRAEI